MTPDSPPVGCSPAEPLVVEHRLTMSEAFCTAFVYRIWAEVDKAELGIALSVVPDLTREAYARLVQGSRHDYARCACSQASWNKP
jgi:hypothetical protein